MIHKLEISEQRPFVKPMTTHLWRDKPLRLCILSCGIVFLCGCTRTDGPVGAAQSSIRGEKLFNTYCAACHRRGGQGEQGRVPPLDGSPWVSGSEDRLIRIVLNGLRGPIEIRGEMYNLEMPAFRTLFKDDDIASILAYVRRRYGSPSPSITTKTVTRVRHETQDRKRYWTVEELLRIP